MDPQEFRAWRKRLNMTQTEAGLALGVSARTVISWERGAAPITKAVELAALYLSEHAEEAAPQAAHPDQPLAGQVALVTGGASGMGLAIARLLASRGALVGITDTGDDRLQMACRAIGERAVPFLADNRRVDEVEAAVASLVERAGRIDILVNNAGVSGNSRPIEQIDEDEFSAMFDTHVKGAFFYTRAVVAPMKRQASGCIVNIASHFALIGHDSMSHYVGAKGALLALSRAWAREFAPSGIRVNTVAPALVSTPMTNASIGPAELARRGSAALLGRLAEPEEIAYAVGWLVSDEAAMMTGQVISPNGGMAIVGF